MGELRYRHPGDATAPVPSAPRPGDPDHRRAARDIRRPASDGPVTEARITRDNPGGYDADAQFKHPVPKPEGYLPGDTMGRPAALATMRRITDAWRGARSDHDRLADLHSRRDPAAAPRLREGVDREARDALRTVVNRPDCDDPRDKHPPDGYREPLTRPDGSTVPCLDGLPRRDQTRQGWAGDCGIIAALGAVAACQPEEIRRRIEPQQDGSYRVRLNETERFGGVTEPTGRDVEVTVTPQLPVYDSDPGEPACAKTEDGASWGRYSRRRSPVSTKRGLLDAGPPGSGTGPGCARTTRPEWWITRVPGRLRPATPGCIRARRPGSGLRP